MDFGVDSVLVKILQAALLKHGFMGPQKKIMLEERLGNVDLLAELISKQVGLEDISIARNSFSSNAT